MKNEIDLSKAYAGQIITLRDNSKRTIYRCGAFGSVFTVLDGKVSDLPYYTQHGLNAENDNSGLDIIKIEDPVQVQVARIEGEIKGLEYCKGFMYHFYSNEIEKRLGQLKTELLTLQNNQ